MVYYKKIIKILVGMPLYQFYVAAITICHKLSGLKE